MFDITWYQWLIVGGIAAAMAYFLFNAIFKGK